MLESLTTDMVKFSFFRRSFRLLLASLLAFSLAAPVSGWAHAAESGAEPPQTIEDGGTHGEYVPGEMVVVLDDAGASGARMLSGGGSGDGAAALQEQGLEVIEEVAPATQDTGTVLNVRVPEGATVEEATAELSASPGVAYAQPNYLYRLIDGVEEGAVDEGFSPLSAGDALAHSVDDPLCNDTTSYNANQYYLYQSKTVEAWDDARSDGAVTVAVLDTGCRLDHVDLQGVLDAEHAYDTFNNARLVDLSANGTVANGDAMGHGTHVSGIIGAQANNGIGMAGSSYNATVLPIKVFDNEASSNARASTADIREAYAYLGGLMDAGDVSNLRVINLSLGFYPTDPTQYDTAFEDAIKAMRARGVLTVCAGGNGDERGNPLTGLSLPSDYDACLSVTSLDRDGGNTYWSDYNEYKDVSAPGTYITSASFSSASGYRTLSGTSMASPLVGGIAALLWAADPTLTVDEVVEALETTADPVSDAENDRSTASGSHGAVNAQAAVKSVLPKTYDDPMVGAGEHRNLVLLVRFADSTIGDGATGYNAPYLNGVRPDLRTKWEHLTKQYNAPDSTGYVGWGFRSYLADVSEGQHDVVTDFPQTQADGTVAYLTLEGSPSSYGETSEGAFLRAVMERFNALYPDYDAGRVDGTNDGVVDSVQIIVDGLHDDSAWPYPPHSTTSDNPDLSIGTGSRTRSVFHYNILPTFDSSVHWGTAVHEYLHTLGARDYYRLDGNGSPVGIWDIMAVSARLSKPLALTREQLGWTTIPEHSQAGTYTLRAAGTGGEQAFVMRSPLNDTEYFVVEYRKKGEPVTGLDSKIGGSGLIVYRVNPAYAAEGNIAGNDFVYVFRSGETGLGDAYEGDSYAGNLVNAQVAASGPRTSIGVADMSADITQDALCYSSGQNSGIVIRATGETDDSITFSVEYPDYSSLDLWDIVTSADGGVPSFGTEAIGSDADVQVVSEGSNVYVLASSWPSSYRVMEYDGANWTDLGMVGGDLVNGSILVKNGILYFLGSDYAEGSRGVVLKRLVSGSWSEVARLSTGASYVQTPQMAFVGSDLYVVADKDSRDAAVYRLNGGGSLEQVGPALPVSYLVAPTVFELNGHVAVACGDFEGARESSVLELVDGAWVTRSALTGTAPISSVAYDGGKTYVYQYVDKNTSPRLVVLGESGAREQVVELPSFKPFLLGGSLAASDGYLYLSVVDGQDSSAAVRTFAADVQALQTWEQLGDDVYAPGDKVSSVVAGGKVVVGTCNAVNEAVAVRSHDVRGSLQPPPGTVKHKVVFRADGKIVKEVEFAQGASALPASQIPAVPAKTGYAGSWPSFTLGTDDLFVDAVYVPNTYTVTFKNWNGSVLSSKRCLFGSSVQAPKAVRPNEAGVSYVFAGWSPAFSGTCDQAKDMVYTAQYRTRKMSVALVGSFKELTYGYAASDAVTVRVTNAGTATVDDARAALDVAGAPWFMISEPSQGSLAQGSLALGSLAPGASATFTVRACPGLAVGRHAATLRVWSGTDGNVSVERSLVQTVKELDISRGALYEQGASKPGVADRVYSGTAQVLSSGWRVSVGGYAVPASQLSVAYQNNTHAASASATSPPAVVVTARGPNVVGSLRVPNIVGSLRVPFSIAARSLAGANVSGLPAQLAFTGSALNPEPSVIVGATRLVKGIDYDVSYENNVYAGTARVIVRGKGNYAGSVTKTFAIVRGAPSVGRLEGPIALDTMKAITSKGFPAGSSSTVVLATTNGYWDALTACGLAGTYRAPVLLTDGASLSPQAASEIKRLGATNILVAGGPAAISDQVVSQARAISGVKGVSRFAGATATGTAVKVFKGSTAWSDTAIVATSRSFQDALSVAPYAYAKRAPIFLAEASSGVLSGETLTAIRSGGFKRVFVVGGPAAVGSDVQSQLGSLYAGRLYGATAYETSLAIATWCMSQGMTANNVGVATGDSYYDALAGAAFCGRNNAVLVLVSDSNRVTIDRFVKPHASQIATAHVFGGPAAISAGTLDALASALK